MSNSAPPPGDFPALLSRAKELLEGAINSADNTRAWTSVREAANLLEQVETRLQVGASMPDPKFGRIWSERSSFCGQPTFLLLGQDRLAPAAVMFYVSLLHTVGGDTEGALQASRAMEDWEIKKYAD